MTSGLLSRRRYYSLQNEQYNYEKSIECPKIYHKSLLKQMQYRFEVNFGTLLHIFERRRNLNEEPSYLGTMNNLEFDFSLEISIGEDPLVILYIWILLVILGNKFHFSSQCPSKQWVTDPVLVRVATKTQKLITKKTPKSVFVYALKRFFIVNQLSSLIKFHF